MQITITNDDGVIFEIIRHAEQYDLTKPLARADLVEQIRIGINRGLISDGGPVPMKAKKAKSVPKNPANP